MSWRVAKSLDTLLAQINAMAPKRSKVSDGSIGDASHSARSSDHNPDTDGVVKARDYTHDPKGGFDAYAFAEGLRLAQDQRIKYVISNRRIFSGSNQDHTAWMWRPYTGTNPHDHHTHVSVKPDAPHFDQVTPWVLAPMAGVKPSPSIPAPKPVGTVKEIQQLLQGWGYNLKVDGSFGPITLAAVKKFQALKKLVQDGKVGPYTWIALNDMGSQQPSQGSTGAVPVTFSPGSFKASEKAYEWARAFESFRAYVYNDAGSPAQGYGHNSGSGIPPIPKYGDAPWTKEKAEEVLKVDMLDKEHILNVRVKVPLTQRQVDALCLDQFQQGPIHGDLLEAVNSGKPFGPIIAKRPTSLKGLKRRYDILGGMSDGKRPDPKTW